MLSTAKSMITQHCFLPTICDCSLLVSCQRIKIHKGPFSFCVFCLLHFSEKVCKRSQLWKPGLFVMSQRASSSCHSSISLSRRLKLMLVKRRATHAVFRRSLLIFGIRPQVVAALNLKEKMWKWWEYESNQCGWGLKDSKTFLLFCFFHPSCWFLSKNGRCCPVWWSVGRNGADALTFHPLFHWALVCWFAPTERIWLTAAT